MNIPNIAIVNFSSVADRTLQRAIRAVNRQIKDDFQPLWGCAHVCQQHPVRNQAEDLPSGHPPDLAASAVVYIIDSEHLAQALAYHASYASRLPVGFVFADFGDWTISLSHEVLEMMIDPWLSLFVLGPDPTAADNHSARVWHSYEVCDPVERSAYEIDGVSVSNFVTPSYFQLSAQPSQPNDFLGIGVPAFGALPGSHMGIFSPRHQQWQDIYGADPPAACTHAQRLREHAVNRERCRPGPAERTIVAKFVAQHGEQFSDLIPLTRIGRKQQQIGQLQACRTDAA